MAYYSSIAFPKIFNKNGKYNIYRDGNALKSDLKLFLSTEKGTLYGDPNYGIAFKKIIYSQAAEPLINDLIIDDIFEGINSYFPNRIRINRDDITINRYNIINEGAGGSGICKAEVSIKLSGDLNGSSNMLNITLLTDLEG